MNSRLASATLLICAIHSGSVVSAQVAPPRAPSGPIEVNGIAAKVNGRVITKNQVSFMLAPIYAQLATQFPRRGPQFNGKLKEAETNVIQELIDRQIILDEFKQLGAAIKPNLIDDEIKRQIHELYNGDEQKFSEELKRSRLTMPGYREMTREKMIVQAMRAQQFADAPPPLPNEIQNEYNEIKSSLRVVSKDVITFQKIFIPALDPENPISSPDTQLAHAEDIAKQIEEGKDFTELAKQFSKDAYATEGGIQKDVPRTDLSPEFASIIFESKVGKVEGPLLDRKGFTIIKPIKIDLASPPPLNNEIRQMVEQRVSRKKTSAQYERWIEGRRKRAMIKILY